MGLLDTYKMIAQGGQAQIYDYADDKVLRVLRNPDDAQMLDNEVNIMKALKSQLDVPKVYESLVIDGRPAVVVEKIIGVSILDYIKKHPAKMTEQATLLATLHGQLPAKIDIPELQSSKGRAHYLVKRADLLEPRLKDFIYRLIERLPEGNALCHGDFHPGNILKSGDKNYIIDWFGAYKGVLLSDVAHTYVLLKNVPRFPGINAVQHKIMQISGNRLAAIYISAFYEKQPFDWKEFSMWLAVKAAERVFYGLDAEKPHLIEFIQRCERNKAEPETWYKLL